MKRLFPSVSWRALCRLTGSSTCLLLLLGGTSVAEEVKETKAAVEVGSEAATAATIGRLTDSIKLLASDELDGRGVGTEGLDQAADYLASQFRELGLETEWFEDDGPFQKFTVTSKTELGAEEKNRLALVIRTQRTENPRRPSSN